MSALAGSSVLVTGAGGFIGGHLACRLVTEGAEVRAMVRYNGRGDRGSLEHHPPELVRQMEVLHGDLRDIESVRLALGAASHVFHLGAQIAIPYSYVNPRDYFETNVLGTLNVAQAARDAGVQRLVHTSTSEVYGTALEVPISEKHPLQAQSPYAASKIGADKLIDSFHASFELPTVILRPFNTYGPGQSARAVLPTIISQALTGAGLKLGSLDPERDLTFVSDTVDGFVRAATADGAEGMTVQLGTGEAVSIGRLVEMVGEVLGHELTVETDAQRVRPARSEVQLLLSRPELARETLGWEPTVSLREGVARTIESIREDPSRYRPEEYAV